MVDSAPVISATQLRSRRALLAGALGGIGALAATVIGGASRAQAASGDPLILGSTANSAGTANTSLTTSSTGTALLVTQNGSGTALRGSAVGPGSIAGFFTAQNGTGVSGVTGNPASYGVFAQNNGAAGTAGAVRAAGGNNNGVVGSTANVAKYGVVGSNSAVTGDGVAGVSGIGGTGVIGFSSGGNGVFGTSDVIGVHGDTTGGIAVKGEATTGIGVMGVSASGYAGSFSGPISTTNWIDFSEIQTETPVAPSANIARLFAQDNGEGLTQLRVIFASGGVITLATDPGGIV